MDTVEVEVPCDSKPPSKREQVCAKRSPLNREWILLQFPYRVAADIKLPGKFFSGV